MWRIPNFKDIDQIDLIDFVFKDEKVCIGSFSLLTFTKHGFTSFKVIFVYVPKKKKLFLCDH